MIHHPLKPRIIPISLQKGSMKYRDASNKNDPPPRSPTNLPHLPAKEIYENIGMPKFPHQPRPNHPQSSDCFVIHYPNSPHSSAQFYFTPHSTQNSSAQFPFTIHYTKNPSSQFTFIPHNTPKSIPSILHFPHPTPKSIPSIHLHHPQKTKITQKKKALPEGRALIPPTRGRSALFDEAAREASVEGDVAL